MRAARLCAKGEIRLQNEEMPVPASDEALLKVTAVGLCGSDLHWFSEGSIGDAQLAAPLVLGHEFAGRTTAGVRVAVDPSISCGKCEWCLAGNPNLCPQVIFAGHGKQDGALQEFMAWPERNCFPLPDSIGDAEGAMLEPLGVAIHAVELAKLQTGMTVGVFGSGPIGLLIIQLAKLAGAARIVGTDRLAHRVEAAKYYGADQVFLAENGRESDELKLAVGGRGLDVVFEVAGDQSAVDTAITAVTPGGKVILAGIPDNDHTSFQASVARRKGLTIKLVRRMKHTYPKAIELVTKGAVDVASLITHRFPLERVNEAFNAARRRDGLKVIVEV